MPIDAAARRTLLVAIAGALVALLAMAVFAHVSAGASAGPPVEEVTLVDPVDDGSVVWPYTSRRPGFETRTLPVNVIVLGEHERVREGFRHQAGVNWTNASHPSEADDEPSETGPVENPIDPEQLWHAAHGADRYTFFQSPEGGGAWLAQTYQLYEGEYFGSRHHVRAYESPFGNWTAMQAHKEYWDWFRLRHTVTGTAATQEFVDGQFLGDGRVDDVTKIHIQNADSKYGNGWATLIEFATVGGIVALAGGRRWWTDVTEWERRSGMAEEWKAILPVGVLFGTVVALYVGVRVAGVTLEGLFPWLPPDAIAGGLYPILAVGLPVAAFLASRPLSSQRAFSAACIAFAAGFVMDYAILDLSVVPVELLLHRLAVVLALGVIAASGALSTRETDDWHDLLAIGVAGWIVALGLPLFGLI